MVTTGIRSARNTNNTPFTTHTTAKAAHTAARPIHPILSFLDPVMHRPAHAAPALVMVPTVAPASTSKLILCLPVAINTPAIPISANAVPKHPHVAYSSTCSL